MGQTTGKVFFKLSCQAENGNQTSPETFWDSDQLGLFSYSQKCIEHDQLSTMKHNGYCYSQMIYWGNVFLFGCDTQRLFKPCSMRVVRMVSVHWGYRGLLIWSQCIWDLRNNVFENLKQCKVYPLVFKLFKNEPQCSLVYDTKWKLGYKVNEF